MSLYRQLMHIRINDQHTLTRWIEIDQESIEEVFITTINHAIHSGWIGLADDSVKIEVASKSDFGKGIVDTYWIQLSTTPGIDYFEKTGSKEVAIGEGTRIINWNPWVKVDLRD